MKKNILFITISAFINIVSACGGSDSNNASGPSEIQVKHEAYDKGYYDGQSHRTFDSSNDYSGSFRAVYLLKYKEGYNDGQYGNSKAY